MKTLEIIEDNLKAAGFGLIFFFSAIFSLMLNKDMAHLKLFSDKLFLISGTYIILAIIIRFVFSFECTKNFLKLFTGPAMLIWIFMIIVLFPFLNLILEPYMQHIVKTHIFVALVILIGNFLYMRKISAKLNNGNWKDGFKLVEDLPLKPKNEDEFMQYVYEYCRKNSLEIEVIKYGMPAIIKLEDELNEVSLQSYLSMAGGIIYTLEFKNIT